ncbi:MAG TPA: hypothetical protein VH062_02805 [Polyangiaceae bacterium]|jgi:hypothetical protein|nr:hypothetical protein [Polyangiaceae bacterium]
MTRKLVLSILPLVGGAALSLGMLGCSSDKSSDSSDGGATSTGGSSAGGSSTGNGGSSTSTGGSKGGSTSTGGSTASTGGKGGAAGAADVYVCDKIPPRDPGGTGKAGDSCCKTSKGFSAGACVKTSSISDPLRKVAYGHDTCASSTDAASDLKCEPTADAIADAGTLGVYEKCTAKLGGTLALEGRCLPKCFVAGMAAASNLAQETCMTADFVCAPCYNPIDGTDTGACSQKDGDKPVDPAPAKFKTCGALKAGGTDLGICVPSGLVTDPVQKAALDMAFTGDAGVADLCATGDICAPATKANDINACFKHCKSAVGDGACVPTYLVPANERSVLSSMPDTCDKDNEECAPCLNPLSSPANQPTGACN